MTCRLISGVGRMGSMAVLLTALSTFGQGACSSAAMDGTWLYRVEGKMYKASGPNPAPTATTTDFAAVGIMRLNGGNGVATESASNAGELSERTFPVTYSVDADCRGRLSLTYCPDKCSGAVDVRNLTFASDSSEGYFLNAIPNTSIVGELRKAVAGNCGNSTITGAYRYITSRTGLN